MTLSDLARYSIIIIIIIIIITDLYSGLFPTAELLVNFYVIEMRLPCFYQ